MDAARAAEYERFARDVSLPVFREHGGFLGALMGRDGSRCVVVTCWRSRADVDALDASPRYRALVERIGRTGLLLGEQTTEAFAAHLGDTAALRALDDPAPP
ncbi:hypothetical protein GTQ99_16515 [Kineococcus sp. T13]|uniref:hypothetical protein n=1 Tax=Kineococcus vitellinus TaxID=2696565 RepID=UPI0014132D8F|nr:hypothetical protein [Kineococcus vitellinus]NAZ77013.1 hypothetical protein [Kineococcus vitellinus]